MMRVMSRGVKERIWALQLDDSYRFAQNMEHPQNPGPTPEVLGGDQGRKKIEYMMFFYVCPPQVEGKGPAEIRISSSRISPES